jgi:hypothetical protein
MIDEIAKCYFILLLILILHLKKRLTILDGVLRYHHACPENIAVPHNVMPVDLGEDPPIFKPPILHLMTRPHPPLHCPLLRRSVHILWTLDIVGVSDVPLVNLDSLPWVQEMMQFFVEYFDICVLTHGVRTLDPHQVPPQDTHAQLIAEGGFPCILRDANAFPFVAIPF